MEPDQIAHILTSNENLSLTINDILYFCEYGGDNCGVHGQYMQGQYFTILHDAGSNFGGKTTGLAFSPKGMFMFILFQRPGLIFEIQQTDGRPFQGQHLNIKYHQLTDNPNWYCSALEF